MNLKMRKARSPSLTKACAGCVKGILAVMLLLSAVNTVSYSAFEETSVGARPTAMGGVYVALAEDVYSIYHNPAGLAKIERGELTAQYSRLHLGLTDNSNLGYSFVGAAQPLKFRKDYGTVGLGWKKFELSGLYNESTLTLSYAKHSLIKNMSLGLNVKMLSLSYGSNEYTNNALDNFGTTVGSPDSLFVKYGTSVKNFDADLGLQYYLFKNYKIGFMIANLLEPNMALDKSVNAKVPLAYKIGFANINEDYSLTLDSVISKFNNKSGWKVAFGGEKWLGMGLGLRSGIVYGNRDLAKVSCGFGYKMGSFQFDYALVYPLMGVKGTFGNHRVSLLAKFGNIVRGESYEKELTEKLMKEKEMRLEAEEKLSAAQKEIEQLRSELEELLKKPAPKIVPKDIIIPKAEPAKETEKKVKPAEDKVKNADYLRDWSAYQKVAENLTLPKRIKILKNMLDKYSGKIRVPEAQQEYDIITEELKAQEKYYKDSLMYYRRMVNQGISEKERINILKRMVRKYEAIGVDVKDAQAELEKLQ